MSVFSYSSSERENSYGLNLGMKRVTPPLGVLQPLNNTMSERLLMSELGKVEERLGIDMDLYHMPCKTKSGFGF